MSTIETRLSARDRFSTMADLLARVAEDSALPETRRRKTAQRRHMVNLRDRRKRLESRLDDDVWRP